MTGPEFRAALKELHLGQHAFATRFGILPGTVSRWVKGHRAVPSWVPPVLEMLREHSMPRRGSRNAL
jgi:transcriptional regulator with XRE-family HTH domain